MVVLDSRVQPSCIPLAARGRETHASLWRRRLIEWRVVPRRVCVLNCKFSAVLAPLRPTSRMD